MIRSLILFTGLLATGCVSSIAPKGAVENGADAAAQTKGRALLELTAKVHGLERWQTVETFEVEMTDLWQGFVGRLGNPWPKPKVDVRLQFRRGSFDARAEFLNDPDLEGLTWGVQSFKPYTVQEGGKVTFVDEKDIGFILNALQYFIEFPERGRGAEFVTYAGKRTVDGTLYDLVYITWGQLEAHSGADQYVAFINPKTHRMEKISYTVRDIAGFVSGTIHFDRFRDVDGVLVPFLMTVTSEGETDLSDFLHQMVVKSVRLNPVPTSVFRVDPALPLIGDSKL